MPKRAMLGLLVVAGCAAEPMPSPGESTTDAEDPSRGTLAASDPPAAPDRGSPGAAGVEPVLLSWGFEPAGADCNRWPTSGGVGIRAAPPRTGAYSCKVCSDGSTRAIELTREVGAVPAGRYELIAWIRGRAGTPAPARARARLEADRPSSPAEATSPFATVREAWDPLAVSLDLDRAASNLRLTIGAPEVEAGQCLFVDDVALVRRR